MANLTAFEEYGKLELSCDTRYRKELESLSLEQLFNTHQTLMESFAQIVRYKAETYLESAPEFFKEDPCDLLSTITEAFTLDQMASEIGVQISSMLDTLYRHHAEKKELKGKSTETE